MACCDGTQRSHASRGTQLNLAVAVQGLITNPGAEGSGESEEVAAAPVRGDESHDTETRGQTPVQTMHHGAAVEEKYIEVGGWRVNRSEWRTKSRRESGQTFEPWTTIWTRTAVTLGIQCYPRESSNTHPNTREGRHPDHGSRSRGRSTRGNHHQRASRRRMRARYPWTNS